MKPIFKSLLLATLILLSNGVNAQKFHYIVDFGFNFDNLESSDPYEPTRSLFRVKLAPQVGVKLGENHMLMAGADILQTLGDSIFPTRADYTLYYRFKNDNFGAVAGSFPRSYSVAHYPRSFFREDYCFFDTNIEGLMLQYANTKKTGYAEFFFDWYGMNEKLRIDEFLLAASSEYTFYDKKLIVGANLLLNHFKKDYYLGDAFLLERTQYNLYVGTDLQSLAPKFEELRVSFGTLSSMEHKRMLDRDTPWVNSVGWQANISVMIKGFGLSNDFYFGDPQFAYHSQYGSEFYPGLPFYQAKRYN
ncbi:MAG: hypothetical protein RR277_04605, partial [Rikenellaceae bacterium]